jgi:hypothetical protein
MRKLTLIAAAGFAAAAALAVETKVWTQSDAAEFEKGTLKGLAVSSEGRVTLAPVFKETYDAAVPHLWCTAVDGKGQVFAGGSDGKVFAADAAGNGKVLATLEGGAVYAIAVNVKGEVFAAVSPEAKIYRIGADGKAALFHTSAAKYIWAIVPDNSGALYVATGDPGEVQKIGADGKASTVFDTGETHVRSLARNAKGEWIAGTEPGGLVIRVDQAGKGFVLHQTGRREVTALATAADGTVWAAAAGGRPAVAAPPVLPVAPAPQPPPTAAQAQPQPQPQQTGQAARPLTPPPTLGAQAMTLTGGSEVWRIGPDGEPVKAWTSTTVIVYAMALDGEGKPVLGTGNDGGIVRVDSDLVSTRLVNADPSQVTGIQALPGGGFSVATANSGRLFRLGPELEKEGVLESDLFDAGGFTYWGRLRQESELNGGSVQLETRSGNLDRAQHYWSPWAPPDAAGRIVSPPARFLGWKASIKAGAQAKSPVLKLVEAAYQAKNVAPRVESVETVPPNYRFPSGGSSLTASGGSLTLPPIGQKRRSNPASPASEPSGTATVSYAKGWAAARWKASDANGDLMKYKVEIRGVGEKEWKLLKDDTGENRVSWDTTGWSDGLYVLRVTASDADDNYPGQGLSSQAESEPFPIDNAPPKIESLTARVEGDKIVVRFTAVDALTPLASAECSVNGGEWVAVMPTTRITDSQRHDYAGEMKKPAGADFTVAVKVSDEHDNVAVHKTVLR